MIRRIINRNKTSPPPPDRHDQCAQIINQFGQERRWKTIKNESLEARLFPHSIIHMQRSQYLLELPGGEFIRCHWWGGLFKKEKEGSLKSVKLSGHRCAGGALASMAYGRLWTGEALAGGAPLPPPPSPKRPCGSVGAGDTRETAFYLRPMRLYAFCASMMLKLAGKKPFSMLNWSNRLLRRCHIPQRNPPPPPAPVWVLHLFIYLFIFTPTCLESTHKKAARLDVRANWVRPRTGEFTDRPFAAQHCCSTSFFWWETQPNRAVCKLFFFF